MKVGYYYINLDHRNDRKESILKQLGLLGIEATRIPGVIDPNGDIGCSESHVKALEKGLQDEVDVIVVFEDDMYTLLDEKQFKDLLLLPFLKFPLLKMLKLGDNVQQAKKFPGGYEDDQYFSASYGLDASCYAVRRRDAQQLINLFTKGISLLKEGKFGYCDRIWYEMQTTGQELLATKGVKPSQVSSYSGIRKGPNYHLPCN